MREIADRWQDIVVISLHLASTQDKVDRALLITAIARQ